MTAIPYADRAIPRLSRGGSALGCHTRDSQVFPLFLVCPAKHESLGISAFDGKLAISCPDLSPHSCRKLFERVRSTSWTTKAPVAATDAGL